MRHLILSIKSFWGVLQNSYALHMFILLLLLFQFTYPVAIPEKSSGPTSGGPSIPENFPKSADVGWPMSDEGIFRSGDP
jgi:hypothetical protein